MNEQSQIIAIAELDGWARQPNKISDRWDRFYKGSDYRSGEFLPPYLTSRDAIVPCIQKQEEEIKHKIVHLLADIFYGSVDIHNQWRDCQLMACLFATPPQLSEALLRATGKWKD